MAEAVQYMVSIDGNTAQLAVVGRASYLNCKCVSDFFEVLKHSNCTNLQVDFSHCTGMDSTFMGMLASITLEISQIEGGQVELYNLKGRLLELIENLGLDAILKIVEEERDFGVFKNFDGLQNSVASKSEILNAHEKLVEFNPENAIKFKDVISFLKEQSQKENL